MSTALEDAPAWQDSTPQPGMGLDTSLCDREPIHVPGAIQPYGLLLIADIATREVVAGAGDVDGRLTPAWLGRRLDQLLAQDVGALLAAGTGASSIPMAAVPGRVETFDATLHMTVAHLLVELEPAPERTSAAATMLARIDRAATTFERANDLR